MRWPASGTKTDGLTIASCVISVRMSFARLPLFAILFGLLLVPARNSPARSPDTTAAPADSLAAADSAGGKHSVQIPQPDSLMRLLEERSRTKAEKIVYSAEKIIFFPRKNVLLLQGQATVTSAARQIETDSMIAYNRSTGEIFVSGHPELKEGQEQLKGKDVHYNILRDRGIILDGRTEFGGWFLESDSLSKVGQDSIFGRGNLFTSCDLAQAKHFHFQSSRIKVIRNKRAFASPVVLKVGEVPVFILPFVFFPITTGNRNSGILQPRIGVNSVARDRITGRTIGNLGYFWAPNDYLDLLGSVDIRTSSQTTLRGRTRYRKRYSYDGSLDIRRVTDKINHSTAFSMFGSHNQTFGERSRLSAEINYTSTRDLLQRTDFDQQNILRQSLRSTASFAWRPSWGSLTSSARHEKFLQQSRTVVSLPSLSLSLNKRNLFPYRAKTVPRRHGLLSSGWLYNITYGLSTNYSNTRTTVNDTTGVVQQSRTGLDLDNPQTIYGWLNLNPSLRYSTQLMNDNRKAADKFTREQSLDLSTSLATQIFGFFNGPQIGPIFRWRHTIRPRLTYVFQPDLTSEKNRGKNSRMSFTISNDIDYKYHPRPAAAKGDSARATSQASESAQPEKEGKLLSIRNSLDYDFVRAAKRDTLGWGALSTSITSSPTSLINLQLLMSHDLLERGRVEHFKPFMSSLSTTLTLRGTYKAAGKEGASTADLEEEAYQESLRYPNSSGSPLDARGLDYDSQRDLAFSRAMPWTINLSHNLSRTRGAAKPNESLRWSFTFNPTPLWHLVYSSSYNFRSRGLQGQRFVLNRDLHCWRANLSLVTLNTGRFEFVFSTYLLNTPAIRVPDVRRASN